MRRFSSSGLLVIVSTVLIAGSLSAGVLVPIAVTGWEEDVVIGVGESYNTGSTAQLDNPGVGSGATVWYGVGHNGSAPSTGLPTGLTQSETTEDLYFQLQSFGSAEGTANNAVYEGGTLVLVTPTSYKRIALIGATGQGTADITVTLKYTTGEDDVFSSLGSSGSVNQDWFGGSSVAYTADGRISTVSGGYEAVYAGNPRLYENIFTADETRLLESVVITDNAEPSNPETPQHNVIMAMSGEGLGDAIPEPSTFTLASLSLMLFGLRRVFRG